MYSVILLAGMTAAPAVPEFLPRSTGCQGVTAVQAVRVKVEAVANAAPVRSTLATVNAARPHLLGRLAEAHRAKVASRAGAGCCGVTATVL